MPSEYLAEYYAQSMSYVLQRWLESDLVLPASEVAKLYYYILNNSMEEIVRSRGLGDVYKRQGQMTNG